MGPQGWADPSYPTQYPKSGSWTRCKSCCGFDNSNSQSNAAYTSLLVDCRLLLNRIPLARVNHVFREANHCADALTKNGCTLEEAFCVFDSAPPFVKELLCSDVNGVNYCRLSATNLAILASIKWHICQSRFV